MKTDWLENPDRIFPFANDRYADPDYELTNSPPMPASQQRKLMSELHAAWLGAHDENDRFLCDINGDMSEEQKEAVARYLNVRRTFIEAYSWLPLRVAGALRQQCHKVSINDLSQQAFIGLITAVDKNQFREGVVFSGYAIKVIMTNIHQWLDQHARVNSLPSEKIEFFLSRISWDTFYKKERVKSSDQRHENKDVIKKTKEYAITKRTSKRIKMLYALAKELDIHHEEFIGSTVAEILIIYNAVDIGARIAGLDVQSAIGIISQMVNEADAIVECIPVEENMDPFLASARRTLMEEIIDDAGQHGWILRRRHIEGDSLNEIREKYVTSGRSKYGTCTRTRVRKMIFDAHKYLKANPQCREKLKRLQEMGKPGFDIDGDKYVARERCRAVGQ